MASLGPAGWCTVLQHLRILPCSSFNLTRRNKLKHAEFIVAPNLASMDLTGKMYSLVDYSDSTALTPANITNRKLERLVPLDFVLVCSYLLCLRNSDSAIAEGTIGSAFLRMLCNFLNISSS
jgi:hypothetical protein